MSIGEVNAQQSVNFRTMVGGRQSMDPNRVSNNETARFDSSALMNSNTFNREPSFTKVSTIESNSDQKSLGSSQKAKKLAF